MNAQSPIVSEFETTEKAQAYEAWLKAKITASLEDARSPVPHDEAMKAARIAIDKNGNAKTCLAR